MAKKPGCTHESVAFVTGGGRGLGHSFAGALAKVGMNFAVAARDISELNGTVELLRAVGVEAIAIPTDVANESAVLNMVSITEEKLGPINLLINGAAVSTPFGPTWETAHQTGGETSK